MLDPFPLPRSEVLTALIQPYANALALPTLPLHIHEVAFAFTLYHMTYRYISPALSSRLFPGIYPSFNARTKLNWDVHVVSFVQSSLINTLALWVMWSDTERKNMRWEEKVWGYTGASGLIQGFAMGYFLWDLVITGMNLGIFGLGMLAHAVSALFVFSLGFRPFLNFYGPVFILYELSSPFLNIHWFCDKLNMTGSNIQLYNGICLLFTFFSCRLVWGTYQSIVVFKDVYSGYINSPYTPVDYNKPANSTVIYDKDSEMWRFAGQQSVPLWLAVSYLASNLTLNGLNWFWFSKMIATIRKRFDPPFGTRKPENEKVENEHVLVEGIDVDTDPEADLDGRDIDGAVDGHVTAKTSATDVDGEAVIEKGVYADGRKTVEVGKRSVRSRRRG